MLKNKLAEITQTAPATTAGALTQSAPAEFGKTVKARSRGIYIAPALLASLLVMLYWRIAFKLVTDWYREPDQSYGFIIPFFIAYLLWKDREAIRRIPQRPSWSGLPLILLALLTLLVGVLGADLFLSRISFLLLAIGLAWSLWGLQLVKQLRFILFMAVIAIPLPAIVLNQITFPLQLQASELATALLTTIGVPVLREGNVLQLPAMQLEVAEACSGIRSLLSLLTVAIMYGYFTESHFVRRAVLASASIPIAIAANAARIFGTGLCVQYWDPDKALGFFHEFSGWLMFLVSLACLYILHVVMNTTFAKRIMPT
jgi:exosortase